jgi:hypothetical protein
VGTSSNPSRECSHERGPNAAPAVLGVDVDFLEMGQVFCEHLDQGKPDRRTIGEGNPESAVCLRLAKVALACRFV